jgi:hypothetical protein
VIRETRRNETRTRRDSRRSLEMGIDLSESFLAARMPNESVCALSLTASMHRSRNVPHFGRRYSWRRECVRACTCHVCVRCALGVVSRVSNFVTGRRTVESHKRWCSAIRHIVVYQKMRNSERQRRRERNGRARTGSTVAVGVEIKIRFW